MPKAAARAGAPSARSGDLERIRPQILAVSKIHIDDAAIIEIVHARRQPMIPASTSPPR